MKGERWHPEKTKEAECSKNEYQRQNGTYRYDYKDAVGNSHSIYANDLASLREKEKQLLMAQWQGVDVERGNTLTLNGVFDRYIQTKFGLKESTVASYNDMYDRYVREEFGKQLIKSIRYSDIQSFYAYLLKKKKVSMRSVEYMDPVLEGFKEEYRYCCAKGFSDYELEGFKDFIFTKANGKVYTSNRLDKALTDIVNSY